MREVYKKSQGDLWDEYCRLHGEVKELVMEKKLTIWNELVEKVNINIDFDGSRKEFWAKHGVSGKVCLLKQLFAVVWHEETTSRQWTDGLIVNLFKKGIGRIWIIIEISRY